MVSRPVACVKSRVTRKATTGLKNDTTAMAMYYEFTEVGQWEETETQP